MAMMASSRSMLLAGLCFGCGAADSGSIDAARDEGGPAEWTLDTTPVLHTGDGLDGDQDLQFSYIEGVHRMPGGSIAVLDSWATSLSFLSESGALLGRVGRQGNGPGEFPQFATLRPFSCGTDSVYVQTGTNVQVFVPPGEYVRSFAMDRIAWVEACSGMRMLARTSYGSTRREAGIFTDSMVLHLYDLEGEPVTVFDTIANDERVYVQRGRAYSNGRRFFGNAFSIDGNSSGFVVGYSGDSELAMYGSAAEPLAAISVDGWQEEISGDDIEALRNFLTPESMDAADRRRVEDQLQAASGRLLPAWGEVKLDSYGNIWIRQYDFLDTVWFFDRTRRTPTSGQVRLDGPRAWKVFDAAGELITELNTPDGFEVHEIGSDWILGVWKDEMDVQAVQMYRLTKRE